MGLAMGRLGNWLPITPKGVRFSFNNSMHRARSRVSTDMHDASIWHMHIFSSHRHTNVHVQTLMELCACNLLRKA